ncbi:MAG: hypothetical protein QGF67_14285 [Lentisphaeria bacterium]|nr:hypothetical protein [Lentisphaeria bacterium]MDP7742606.1 hypothetical protein [Lentisphaeria bacterium]
MRWRAVITLVASLGLALRAIAGDVRISGFDAGEQKRLLGISAAAAREVRSVIGGAAELPAMTVCRRGADCAPRSGGSVFVLDPNDGRLAGPQLILAHLQRYAIAHGGRGRKVYCPEWLVAGLYHRMLEQRMPPFSRNRVFAATKVLVEARQLPRLRNLLDNPVAVSDPIVYELYAESCALLIKMLRQHDRRILGDMIGHRRQGPDSAMLFARLASFEGDEGAIQDWYELQAEKLVVNIVQPLSLAAAKARRRELETVPMVMPDAGGDFGVTRVPLDEVHYHFQTYDHNPDNVNELLSRFVEFRWRCPLLLRAAVDDYIGSLRTLRNGKEAEFETQIRAARRKFDAACTRAAGVGDFLDRVGAAHRLSLSQLELLVGENGASTELPYDKPVRAFLDPLGEAP